VLEAVDGVIEEINAIRYARWRKARAALGQRGKLA
jgi:hypothetical protein